MGVPSMQSRIFVDFWNFTLQWQSRSAGADADWRALPQVLHARTQEIVRTAGAADVLELDETLVYASYEPGRDDKLRDWLDTWLHPQPGFRVIGSERAWRPRSVHCRECGTTTVSCPHCRAELGHAGEKGIDVKIVTDLVAMAWEDAYSVAVLLSSDKDFIPAVECLQERNYKIVNATWRGAGVELARTCWAAFYIDDLMPQLVRGYR
jgi:hypothetical protein